MPHPERTASPEDEGRWLDAAALWKRRYEEAPNAEAAIRLAFVCWYALDGFATRDAPLSEAEDASLHATLSALAQDAVARFGSDPDVLFYLGYMANILPWYFAPPDADGTAVLAWEERARGMLREAHRLQPTDPIFEAVVLGLDVSEPERREAYERARARSQAEVASRFGGPGEFDGYFRSVLSAPYAA